ncbi:hypothetical protein [Endozoicomonas acroporae]|uniref:hypothetical protein n=1 Tax=Endozoicomonas acroporae TaxID=1701104 RepID=UPI0013D5F345|nr:hypothetical protein [Endozoicomonas acroporae]
MDGEEPKLYTLFSYYHSNFIHGAEDRQGNIESLPWMDTPNAPRLSLDGMQGIVTGVYEFSSAQHLTQAEAEALMQTEQWTNESMENTP